MRTIKWEKKVTKTFLIMLVLFMSCFFPSLLMIYIISFCGTCDCIFIHWARDFNYVLIMANSSINPFVFAWRLQPYRKAFTAILTCRGVVRRLRSLSEQMNISINSLSLSTQNRSNGHSVEVEWGCLMMWNNHSILFLDLGSEGFLCPP